MGNMKKVKYKFSGAPLCDCHIPTVKFGQKIDPNTALMHLSHFHFLLKSSLPVRLVSYINPGDSRHLQSHLQTHSLLIAKVSSSSPQPANL